VAIYLITEAPQVPAQPVSSVPFPAASIRNAKDGRGPDPVVAAKRKRDDGQIDTNKSAGISASQPKLKKPRLSTGEPDASEKKKQIDDASDNSSLSLSESHKHDVLSEPTGQDGTHHHMSHYPTSPPSRKTIPVFCDIEQVPDVHIRNSILLRTSPQYIVFSSLPSIITAIKVTPSFSSSFSANASSLPLPLDVSLSKLKTLCNEKHVRDGLMKNFTVKGNVSVMDLTEEVEVLGDSPEEHGSFADIWKGEWQEKVAGGMATVKRTVALKVLRQCMGADLKGKLLARLKCEVLTWHRLRHPNIASLFGIVQMPQTLSMVSPWCKNGTITGYLKTEPSADRLKLLVQIATGVGYLHDFKPVVIHGDLKGNNILIDDRGNALITDFGMSEVIEDFSSGTGSTLATSFFGGATRWMAPELILALVEDDGKTPELTKWSDVYAFAAVCLEVMTGKYPYPLRSNTHAVTMDKMRGVRPSCGAQLALEELGEGYGRIEGEFWRRMERCWDEWYLRPSMTELTVFLAGLVEIRDA